MHSSGRELWKWSREGLKVATLVAERLRGVDLSEVSGEGSEWGQGYIGGRDGGFADASGGAGDLSRAVEVEGWGERRR
jgi:hypothetical protein